MSQAKQMPQTDLSCKIPNNLAVNVGKAELTPLEAVSQLLVVDAEEVEDCLLYTSDAADE